MSKILWVGELKRLLIIAIVFLLAVALTRQWLLALCLSLIVYLAWLLYQFYVLDRWLHGTRDAATAPEFMGIADSLISTLVNVQKEFNTQEKKLKEIVSQFETIISALPDAVAILDRAGEIKWTNHAAQTLLGIDINRDKNKRITQLLRDPTFTTYYSKADFTEPIEIRRKSQYELELSMRVIPYGEDRYMLLAQDFTEIARVYAMRRAFISNASHELRTPLTVIIGYLESLTLRNNLSPEQQKAISAAEQQAHRMKQLVEDLLTLSRLESTSSVELDADIISMSALITELVRDVKHLESYAHHVVHQDVNPTLAIRGSYQEIHSAVGNLINNAVKHTVSNTVITIRWGMDTKSSSAVFIVEDNGPGIDPEHIPHLTERFYRVDPGRSRARGGTGLGLSIVKHVIERHGGELKIESNPGRGARFICRFPPERIVFEEKLNENN